MNVNATRETLVQPPRSKWIAREKKQSTMVVVFVPCALSLSWRQPSADSSLCLIQISFSVLTEAIYVRMPKNRRLSIYKYPHWIPYILYDIIIQRNVQQACWSVLVHWTGGGGGRWRRRRLVKVSFYSPVHTIQRNQQPSNQLPPTGLRQATIKNIMLFNKVISHSKLGT